MKILNNIKWVLASFLVSSLAFSQTEVTLLVVYTDDARIGANSVDNIESQIISAIDDGNQVLDNSNVDMTLSIVGMRELAVDEGIYSNLSSLLRLASLNNDLSNPEDETFGIVHNWRNETEADLVYLVFEGIQPNGRANEICGSNLPCDNTFEEHAFAVGQRGLMLVAPLVIHELGHVMGLRHDRTRDCLSESAPCGTGAFDFSFGHIDPSATPSWGTIMAGGRPFGLLDFFSNPNLTHPTNGADLGIEDFSDASRSLDEVRLIVASFREDALDDDLATLIVTTIIAPLLLPN